MILYTMNSSFCHNHYALNTPNQLPILRIAILNNSEMSSPIIITLQVMNHCLMSYIYQVKL